IDEDENGNKSNAAETEPVFTFNASPNPANDYFVVEYDLATKDFATAEIRMFNKNGEQVYKQGLTKRAFQLLIETESFEPGVYVCRLYNNSKQLESKTIVIKPNLMTDSEIINEAETMLGNETLFMVYPNPTSDFVTINTNRTENCVLELYNASGVRVYQSNVISTTTKINTTNYKTGIYYVRLVKEGEVLETVKLIVE
ncbi:MAG: T9SS type A sorting domain-containing protein, partial [Salinivirgaceae bacterium]|nr:T9SS type A sorting domain-containing protein [Salinivirgaceae bacterium]